MNRVKKIVKLFFGIPLTIVAFVFIGKIILDSWPNIQELLSDANPYLLVIGIFFMMGFFLIRSLAWVKILNFFAPSEKTTAESIFLFSLAETKRYIPGNIFSFLSRIQKFNKQPYSKKTVIHAMVFESFLVASSALLISVVALVNLIDLNGIFSLVAIASIALLIFLTASFFLLKKSKFKIYGHKLSDFFPHKSFFSYLNIFSIYAAAWICFGIGNFFFSSALFATNPNYIIIFSSMFVAAWIIGYISFITPMGLGVREAAIIYLFSPFMPIYAATAVSVFTRIFIIISEVIFLTFSWATHNLSPRIRKRLNLSPISLVAFSCFLYITYFTYFTIVRHLNFFSGKFDLGNMEQTVWNTVHGNFFMFTDPDGIEQLSRLSAHADFILILFAPIYAIYPSVNVLLIAQTAIIGIGGFFVYLIAKKIINSEKIAVLLSIGYYLNYFVQEQNIFDFHSVSLATTFLLGAFYFITTKRYKLFGLMLLLAVMTKENVYLVASLFGAFLFIKGKKIYGSTLFIASIAMFLFLMAVAIPSQRGADHFALSYLSYLGNSTFEIILSPVLRPITFFSSLFSLDSLRYIQLNFLPVGFLSIFAPLYAIFLLPDFMINTLSDNPNLRSIQYHYGALLVPFVYVSAIYGIKKLLSFFKNKKLAANLIFYYLLAFIIYSTWQYSPLPGTKNADIAAFIKRENRNEIHRYLSDIPLDANVAATNNMAAHLVQRENIYVIPNGIDEADYLVFYKQHLGLAREIDELDGKFIPIVDLDDFIIFRKISAPDRAYTP